MPALSRVLVLLLAVAPLAACNPPVPRMGRVAIVWPAEGTTVTVPMQRASGRWLVSVGLRRKDGSERRALAWLNMGAPALILSEGLYRELGIAEGRDLAMRIGPVGVTVDGRSVIDGPGRIGDQDLFGLLFAPRSVEAVLPAGVLRHFVVTVDPRAEALTLARPGTPRPRGVPVPVRVNPDSGVAVADAQIGDRAVSLVLDVGAPYTWLRGRTVATWLGRCPDWRRAEGAVGRANLAMADLGLEPAGTVIRLPRLDLPGLSFADVGALGTGPVGGQLGAVALGEVFWDRWQAGVGEPVAGWLGNNVLDDVRLTLDYPAGQSFWERQRAASPDDLDGVGLTLIRRGAGYA
ncbi:peptide-binding protein, partial [Methylorubrum thiocyanatum]|uniref:peptide-binding protein n=1 Tax=Methylorubrum thiocyanatum TaxID=47958 RepID=UPI003F815694